MRLPIRHDLPARRRLDRTGQLDGLRALAEQTALGRPELALVHGPAGIGRTTLLNQFLSDELRARHTVRRVGCADLARPSRYGAALRLLDVPRDQAGTPRDQAGTADYPMLRALYRRTVALAAAQPLVLALDDTQQADAESLRWLDFLLRRAAGLPLLVVLAIRTDLGSAARNPLGGLLTGRHPLSIELGPLDDVEIATLVGSALRPSPSAAALPSSPAAPGFLAAVRTATGGNPALLDRLLPRLRTAQVTPTEAAVERVAQLGGDVLVSMIETMLGRRTPNVLAVANAIAVLGPAQPEVVAALADIPLGSVEPAVAALRDAGIVVGEPADFRSAALRSAIYGALSDRDFTDLRLRAAGVLRTAACPGDAVARQLIGAPASGLDEAGLSEAARQYLSAVNGDRPGQIQTQIQLAQSLADADPAAALDVLRTVLDGKRDPRTRARLTVRFAVACLAVRETTPVGPILTAALAELDNTTDNGADQDLRTLLLTALRLTTPVGPAELVELRTRIAALVPAPEYAPTQRQLLAMLTALTSMFASTQHAAIDDARRAISLPGTSTGSWAVLRSAVTLGFADERECASDALQGVLDYCDRHSSVVTRTRALTARALLALHFGSVSEALADGQLALACGSSRDRVEGTAMPRILLAIALTERHDLAGAWQQLAGLGPDAVAEQGLEAMVYRYALGRIAWSSGHLENAVRLLHECGELVGQQRNAAFVNWWAPAAYLLVKLGKPEEAQELVIHAAQVAADWDTPRAHGLNLVTMGVVAGGPTGIRLLTDATQVLAGSPARGEYAWAQYLLGRALLTVGDRTAARDALRIGIGLAVGCGRYWLAGAGRTALVLAGGRGGPVRRSPLAVLTDSERRVAELAASGSSNRAIAELLFVTVRTVEQHLTSVYRKLNLNQRTDLAAILDNTDAGGQRPPRLPR